MRLLTLDELATSLRVGKPTLRTWIAVGSFPAGLKLGPRTLRWREDQIRKWLEAVERAGVANPSFRASDWEPECQPATAFERLSAATEDELAASLVELDTAE